MNDRTDQITQAWEKCDDRYHNQIGLSGYPVVTEQYWCFSLMKEVGVEDVDVLCMPFKYPNMTYEWLYPDPADYTEHVFMLSCILNWCGIADKYTDLGREFIKQETQEKVKKLKSLPTHRKNCVILSTLIEKIEDYYIMICYRDRTFCSKPCGNRECSRIKTIQLIESAEDFGLPIAIADFSDSCGMHEEPEIKCGQCNLGMLESETVIGFGADHCPNCESVLSEK